MTKNEAAAPRPRQEKTATRARAKRARAADSSAVAACASSARTRLTTSTTRTSGCWCRLSPERGKIQPRRISGTCALHQRKLQTAIARARQLALIPFTSRTERVRGSGVRAVRRWVQGSSFRFGGPSSWLVPGACSASNAEP